MTQKFMYKDAKEGIMYLGLFALLGDRHSSNLDSPNAESFGTLGEEDSFMGSLGHPWDS